MKTTDPRVDVYIRKSAAFAQPILRHLRALVHRGCPEAGETLKWSMPAFTLDGKILCHMAAFKAHCAFGFWHQRMLFELGRDGGKAEEAMGAMGRVTRLEDLPRDEAMLRYIRLAVTMSQSGEPARPKPKTKRALPMPADLTAALKKNAKAGKVFADFSPSAKRDYIEWITEAKREATRASRLVTAVGWVGEGKTRNWKYQNLA
ncbi:MAG: hypothetical protein JWM32_2689 [Verrucomicrobia bacterium]|nr:hypothetical protein [Verrucomicrobiota bacterium]